MKNLFKDRLGWITFGLIALTISGMGFTKLLSKNINLSLIILLIVSCVAVCIFNRNPNDL